MIQSPNIEEIVQLALADGNEIVEISTGWTKVTQVIHMRQPLSYSVKNAALVNQGARYWTADPTPHDKAAEGFTDDVNRVSIAFPC